MVDKGIKSVTEHERRLDQLHFSYNFMTLLIALCIYWYSRLSSRAARFTLEREESKQRYVSVENFIYRR